MTAHISERNREVSRSAIEIKLGILEQWTSTEIPWLKDDNGDYIRDTHGERQLDFFPSREVHFASWSGTENCAATHSLYPKLAQLKAISRSTLRQPYHSDLQQKMERTLTVLRMKASNQLQSANKTSLLHQEESKAKYWEALARKQNSDIVVFRERMLETEVKLRRAERALINNTEEHQRVVDSLNAKIAGLTELLAKVTPLRQRSQNGAR